MNYQEELRRQWEINIYHNLGFLCNGYTIEETNHGWKNETRDATSIEVDFWNRSADSTPEIPVLQISDSIDLYDSDIPFEIFEDKAIEGRILWLENKYEKALCAKSTYSNYSSWGVCYKEFKEFR
jgi:hypothetical protein